MMEEVQEQQQQRRELEDTPVDDGPEDSPAEALSEGAADKNLHATNEATNKNSSREQGSSSGNEATMHHNHSQSNNHEDKAADDDDDDDDDEATAKLYQPVAQKVINDKGREINLFSMRRPTNIVSGIGTGLYNITAGVGLGVATLVTAPVVGAKAGGWKGFGAGLGLGILGAVTLPFAGAVLGTRQIVRGVWNTPEAVYATAVGKYYDKYDEQWVDFNVHNAIVLDGISDADGSNGAHAKNTAGEEDVTAGDPSSYYKLLNVDKDATDADIRKNYYKLARKYHPDKNMGDPAAQETFQRLGRAYQVLSQPETRAAYDRHGEEGVDNADTMDSSVFFTMLFGSDLFTPFVGELHLATSARIGEDHPQLQRLLERARLHRTYTLTRLLVERLDRHAEQMDNSASTAAHAKELDDVALALCACSFGPELVLAIGDVYISAASIAGGGMKGFRARMSRLKTTMSTQMGALKAAGNMLAQENKAEKSLNRELEKELAKARNDANMRREGISVRDLPSDSNASEDAEEGFVMVDNTSSATTSTSQTTTATSTTSATTASSSSTAANHPTSSNNSSSSNSSSSSSEESRGSHDSAKERTCSQGSLGDKFQLPDDLDGADVDELIRRVNEIKRRHEAEREVLTMESTLKILWYINLVDIQSVLHTVCAAATAGGKYGADPIPSAQSRRRVRALHEIGAAFHRVGMGCMKAQREQAGAKDARTRFQEAQQEAVLRKAEKEAGETIDRDAFKQNLNQTDA